MEWESRSLGGRRGAPWRPHEWEERGGPQSPPSMEDRGSYGGSETTSRRRQWLPPEEEEGGGSWEATSRGPKEPPREYRSSKKEGRRGSWEPPRKRARSPPLGGCLRIPLSPPREDSWESPEKRVKRPPMGEWWRVSLSPPRGRRSTSPDSQRQQPSAPSGHTTHQEPSFLRDSRRDSPSNGGSPWVSRGRRDGPETESRGRSWESPEPAWESCHDPGMSRLASRRATERRDLDRSRRLGEPGHRSSSSSRHRSREDPGWDSRHGNPVDGSYSVKAGGSRERWSGRVFQNFQSQINSRERDNRGRKGGSDEGWSRDEGLSREEGGRSVGSPREIIPQKGQGAKESFRGDFLGPKGGPERYEGHGTQAATTGKFLPRLEVVNYWMRCHRVMTKNTRDKFLSFCPRPYIQDRSSVPLIVNPDLARMIGKHNKDLFADIHFSLQTQWEVLTMLAPAMALFEMAEAAMEGPDGVDPLVVRPLARCLLSFAGSTNRRLTQQRCSEVFRAIDPRLASMVIKMSTPISAGRLLAEDNVEVLKGIILGLEMLPEDPPERNSGPQALLHVKASLELWHRRFGHTNSHIILRLKTNGLVAGLNVDPGEGSSTARCVTCRTEWGPKPPFPVNTLRNSTALMDLVHCELSGPFKVPSLALQRYVLIFVDDFSRFCVTYLLKETGEAHECFENYFSLLRKKQKSIPKAFQLNSAANAVSPQTLSFLEAQGIAYKRGVESLPKESRTAEKEMKSLLKMTRCMLADAGLPEPFWGHAIMAATYLQNRLPFKRQKRTRFQNWYGIVPNVKHLRVFGSLVFSRQEPMGDAQHVFVGYTTCKAGYQCMNLETGEIVRRRTQHFDEGEGVRKGGKFLEAIERQCCDVEALAGIVESMTPQPARYTTPDGGETREEKRTELKRIGP